VLRQLHESISLYDGSGIFERFESRWASMHRHRHALLCSSGTTAIHSMYVAANLGPGDEVICPAYTFFATVTPLLFTGAKPVLCDCDSSGNIDVDAVAAAISPRTRAVVATHMWGVPCDGVGLRALCDKHNLLLLEDCSHAHGAQYGDAPVGSLADIAAWSLQGAKIITGGEGGIIVTSDSDFFARALSLGHYNKRCKQEIPANHPLAQFATTGMGLKYRAHPIAVAIAEGLLDDLPRAADVRARHAKLLEAIARSTPSLTSPTVRTGDSPAWYAYVMQYSPPDRAQRRSAAALVDALVSEGFTEADHPGSTMPLNLLPLFQTPHTLFPVYEKDSFAYAPGDFPTAERFYQNAIKLPVWAYEDDSELVMSYSVGIGRVIADGDW
jgi:perosamine synthetase